MLLLKSQYTSICARQPITTFAFLLNPQYICARQPMANFILLLIPKTHADITTDNPLQTLHCYWNLSISLPDSPWRPIHGYWNLSISVHTYPWHPLPWYWNLSISLSDKQWRSLLLFALPLLFALLLEPHYICISWATGALTRYVRFFYTRQPTTSTFLGWHFPTRRPWHDIL